MARRSVLRAVGPSCVLLLALLCGLSPASASDLTGFVEYAFVDRQTRQELEGQPTLENSTQLFGQRYNLIWNRRIYSKLRLLAGGYFEQRDQQQDLGPVSGESTLQIFRPFVSLLAGGKFVSGELAWNRNQERNDFANSDLTFVRDTYRAVFGLQPELYPLVQLRFFRAEDRDLRREFRDRTDNTIQLIAEYTPRETVYLYYIGALRNTEDAINNNEVSDWSHSGRFRYNNTFLNRRALLNSDWNGVYRRTETTSSGTGEVVLPVVPFEGLSDISDFPEQGPLLPNPALIDDDFTTSAGINLGLPPPAGNDEARNIGFDFATETEINQLFVWIDRDIPLDTAASFDWRVYTSSDNQQWTLRDIVSPAIFGGSFQTRFEIRFDNVRARYVKVVVEPLELTDPDAINFPDILVTEIEALIRAPAADVEGTSSIFSQIYNMNFRYRLLNRPQFFYELGFFLTDSTLGRSQWTLSNGFSVTERFARIYSVSARYARQDLNQEGFDRTANQLTGSLSADPLETLRLSVVYSGRTEESSFQDAEVHTVFLLAVMELYRGVSLNTGFGRGYRETSPGRMNETQEANGTLSLRPHPTLTMNLFWQDRREDVSGGGAAPFQRNTSAAELNAAWRPIQALYLYGAYRVEDRPIVDDRTVNRYQISFSPFRDGTLSLVLNYNENMLSDLNTKQSVTSTRLRWQVRGNTFVNLGWSKIEQESDLNNSVETNVIAALRFGF